MIIYSLRTKSEMLHPREYAGYYIKSLNFDPSYLELPLPDERWRRNKRDFFIYLYNDFVSAGQAKFVFSAYAFHMMKDLLIQPSNQIKAYLVNDTPLFYSVYPTSVECGDLFPNYQQIANNLPHGVHFFRKFDNSDFLCVTDVFVQRVKQHDLKGFGFQIKWDGKRILPASGATAY